MNFKRNFNLYIKQKSTIIALVFYVVFIVLSIISFVSPIFDIKGISDSFKQYDITYMTTNNYTVTYAASNNIMFYSQNKSQNSVLNNFAGIKEYSNQYGTSLSYPYNFIKIDYQFDSNIIKIEGISDNYLGENGETLILTEKKNLYLISKRSKMVEYLLNDVDDVKAFYNKSLNNNVYIIKQNDDLSLLVFNNSNLNKYKIISSVDIDSFYFLYQEDSKLNFLIKEKNNLSLVKVEIDETIFDVDNDYHYPIKNIKTDINDSIIISNAIDKMICNENEVFVLKDKRCYSLSLNDFSLKEILCEVNIDDIYFTGEKACIAISNNSLYYYGTLKNHKETTSFESLNVTNAQLYGNRNSLILYKNNKLLLYDDSKKEFVIMYHHTIIQKVLKIFSLFVAIMLTFYFILSFNEAKERYNRYFSAQNQ